jgi:diguanylate cyclase (GGDEF)-like protein
VYAGLGSGLARYDGAIWEPIALPGTSGVHAIGALGLTGDGALWAGSDGAGVFRVNNGRVYAVPGLGNGPAGVVWSVQDDHRGGVWASTEGGLARCTIAGCRMLPALRGIPMRTVLRGIGPNGPCLWMGTGGSGLLRFDLGTDGEPVATAFKLTRADGLPNNDVINLVQWGGAQGRDLWIGTGRGLVRFDGRKLVRYSPNNGFPGSVTVTSMLLGRGADKGLLFVGLRPGGLVLLREDGSWSLVGQAQGLPDSSVQGLAYTDRGSSAPLLWIGTFAGGIARADPGRWQLLDERRDVPSRGMVGLGTVRFPDGMQALWMASAQGALRLTDTGWQPIPGLPPDTVVADLATTADGALWIGAQAGLWRLHGSDRTEFTADNSQLPAVHANLLTVEPGASGEDALWVGTSHGLARWTRADGLRRMQDHPILKSGSSIRALALAALGSAPPSIWVGTDEGLLQRQGDRWRQMAVDCLRGASITMLAAHAGVHGGELWIGTDGPLLRLRIDGCERLDNVFPGGYAEQIAFDRGGRAYVFGTGGAVRLDSSRDTPLATMALTRYGREDGLMARDYLSGRGVATDAHGRVWVASTAALQVFDPASETSAGSSAPLVWDGLRAGSDQRPIRAGDELQAGTSPLIFAARLLAFEREEHIQYRAQLLGLNSAPQPWTSEHRFEYSRLAAGMYEMRLWARDANGVVSGPLSLPFSVLAPWWQRPWALALYALALIAVGLLLGWGRTRALHHRARALTSEVAARTHELADANRLLEEMSRTDTLTGLHNRRHAVDALPDLVRRSDERRHAGAVTQLLFVLIDVDHFKRINDSYGHPAGDAVLKAVAARLRQSVRDRDMLVRWGGEEFLLALNDCDPVLAAARLRSVLAAVSDEPIAVDSASLRISVSAGASAYIPPNDADQQTAALAVEHAIARADAALYEAKNRGRDRAVLVVDAAEAVVGGAHWPEYERNTPEVP